MLPREVTITNEETMLSPYACKSADAGAREITEDMKLAAAYAIAGLVPEDKLAPEYIIPSALDKSVAESVAQAVAKEWERSQGGK